MRDHVVQVGIIHVSILMFTCAVFFAFWIYFLLSYEAISVIQLVGYYLLIALCGVNVFVLGPITFHILKVEMGDHWCLKIILICYMLSFLLSSLPTPFLSNVISKDEDTRDYIKAFYAAEGRPPYLMDYIQRSRHCCGYENYSDYFRKPPLDADVDSPAPEPVPKSCCSVIALGCERSRHQIYKEGCFITPGKRSGRSVWEHPYHGSGFFPVILLPLILPLVHILVVCFLHDAFAVITQKRAWKGDEETIDVGGGGDDEVSAVQSTQSSNYTCSAAESETSISESINLEEKEDVEKKRNDKIKKSNEKEPKIESFLKKKFHNFANLFRSHKLSKKASKEREEAPDRSSSRLSEQERRSIPSGQSYYDESPGGAEHRKKRSIHNHSSDRRNQKEKPKDSPQYTQVIADQLKEKEKQRRHSLHSSNEPNPQPKGKDYPRHIQADADKLKVLRIPMKGKQIGQSDSHKDRHSLLSSNEQNPKPKDSPHHIEGNPEKVKVLRSPDLHKEHQKGKHSGHDSKPPHGVDIPSATQHRMEELDKHIKQAIQSIEHQLQHPLPVPPPHFHGDHHRDQHGPEGGHHHRRHHDERHHGNHHHENRRHDNHRHHRDNHHHHHENRHHDNHHHHEERHHGNHHHRRDNHHHHHENRHHDSHHHRDNHHHHHENRHHDNHHHRDNHHHHHHEHRHHDNHRHHHINHRYSNEHHRHHHH